MAFQNCHGTIGTLISTFLDTYKSVAQFLGACKIINVKANKKLFIKLVNGLQHFPIITKPNLPWTPFPITPV